MNTYTLSKILFAASVMATLILLALSLDPGKLQEVVSTSTIIAIFIGNFILLAIASLFYIWQKASRSTPLRDQLKTLEQFAQTASKIPQKTTRRLVVTKGDIEKILLTQSPTSIPMPHITPAIELSETLELFDPITGYSALVSVEAVTANTLSVTPTSRVKL